MQITSTSGMKHVFCTPYYLQGNQHNENVYNSFKTCLQKHKLMAIIHNCICSLFRLLRPLSLGIVPE